MPTYMTDTHSLLWVFMRPRKLGERARRAFEEIANGDSTLLIPEMHDRMIVATAIEYQATLITIDKSITTSGLVDVVM